MPILLGAPSIILIDKGVEWEQEALCNNPESSNAQISKVKLTLCLTVLTAQATVQTSIRIFLKSLFRSKSCGIACGAARQIRAHAHVWRVCSGDWSIIARVLRKASWAACCSTWPLTLSLTGRSITNSRTMHNFTLKPFNIVLRGFCFESR